MYLLYKHNITIFYVHAIAHYNLLHTLAIAYYNLLHTLAIAYYYTLYRWCPAEWVPHSSECGGKVWSVHLSLHHLCVGCRALPNYS